MLFGTDATAVVTDLKNAFLLGEQYVGVYVRESQEPHISLQAKATEGSHLLLNLDLN